MEPHGSVNLKTQSPEKKQRHRELLALSRVSAAVSGLNQLDAILKVALDNVLSIMSGTIGGILLLDEQTGTLSYRVHRGLSKKYAKEFRMKMGQGISGRVAKSSKPILLEDISTNPRTSSTDLATTEGVKAFISVPLRAKDKVLGVINVASHQPHHFTINDKNLLSSIGDQLGVAIEQTRLYEHLKNARERYRRLARQTLAAQEKERRRIARELHDETSQALSGLAFQLQALVDMANTSGNGDTRLISGLKKVQSLTAHVHSEISRLIADLRPALLDTLGLVSAIRQYAEHRLRPLGINASVETRLEDNHLPPEVEAELFRFTQGAIGNIAQHSRAKNATIVLEYREDELTISISDDGEGFDVSQISSIDENGRGRGVFSMKERIALLGGTCSIESKVGEGTTIWARVPITWSNEYAENKSTGSR